MKTKLTIIALLASLTFACAASKPTIYSHVVEQNGELDKALTAALSAKFNIVDLRDPVAYVPPKPIAGSVPRYARTESGDVLSGDVLVTYVVTEDGRATDPVILKSTDERLNDTVLEFFPTLRFEPARLDGKVVAIAAAQEFNFKAEPNSSATVPTEFVTQVLEPLGGKILRPRDWFYKESHGGPSYTWILSREDATDDPYTTGVRIQTLVGVKEGTGKTPKQFVLDFVAEKKKSANVIKTCPEMVQEFFTRMCLETEEGPYHISYSLFWGNKDLDLVVVSTAGTTKELWSTYASTFDKMSSFELIDMERFNK